MRFQNSFGLNTNTVVGNLLILNILGFLAAFVMGKVPGSDAYALNFQLGLFLPGSVNFKPYQLLTHFFMHGSLMHIFFNMYALVMFGGVLEKVWGAERFLTFYVVCAFGAALIHLGVNYYETFQIKEQLLATGYSVTDLSEALNSLRYNSPLLHDYIAKYSIPTVGASGAVFGLLLGYGMLFPNSELMLMFIPVPIKAKYFVIGYGAIELFSGFARNPGDNIAHFAHLGGMLFGFILIKVWQKNKNQFY